MLEDKTILEQSDGNHGELYPKSSEFAKEGIPYLSASNIIDNNIDYQNVKYLPLLRAEQFKKGVARDGDILLAHNATVGPSALLKINLPFVILSTTLTLYRINKDKMDNLFFLSIIRSNKVQNQLKKMMKQTTRNQVPILAQRTIDIFYPKNLKEQAKVGEFFKQFDDTITLHQRKLEQLKLLKQAFLQKMFVNQGNVPELRFADFSEEWEKRKLGEAVQITMGQSPNSDNYTENSLDHILVQGNADMKNNRVVPRVWTTQITKQAEKGDLILSVRAPVGDIGKTDYDVVLGRGVAAIKGNNFIFQQLGKMNEEGFWNRFSTGSTFESINSNDIKEALINIPNEEEQKKIGSFFDRIDDTITLHQKKLTYLKELKKAFLQFMFI